MSTSLVPNPSCHTESLEVDIRIFITKQRDKKMLQIRNKHQ